MVITVDNNKVSYAKVMAWARENVNLTEAEVSNITTKRSTTGSILLEIKGDKNDKIIEKMMQALKNTLEKYKNVRVHRPKQMEVMIVSLDESVTRSEVAAKIAKEDGCLVDDVTAGPIKMIPRGMSNMDKMLSNSGK